MTATEKNDHYRKLNERFDRRSLLLRHLGFTYENFPIMGQTRRVFVKKHPWIEKYNLFETAAFVLCADDVVWNDRLADLARPF